MIAPLRTLTNAQTALRLALKDFTDRFPYSLEVEKKTKLAVAAIDAVKEQVKKEALLAGCSSNDLSDD